MRMCVRDRGRSCLYETQRERSAASAALLPSCCCPGCSSSASCCARALPGLPMMQADYRKTTNKKKIHDGTHRFVAGLCMCSWPSPSSNNFSN